MTGPAPGPRYALPEVVDRAVAEEHRRAGWWGDLTVSDHVRHHADHRPHGVAYRDDHGVVGWADLDRAGDEMAARLAGAGLVPGDRVAVAVPDGAVLHTTYLAAERAGLTVVGIGTRAGRREVAHLLRRTACRTIVTGPMVGREHAGDLVEAVRSEVPVDRHLVVDPTAPGRAALTDGVGGESVDPVPLDGRSLGPDHLFFLNSTSGTTGLPKCVEHHQNRWMYFHAQAARNAELSADDVVCSLLPGPFGFGLWTAHVTPIVLGATTVLTERFDARRALALLAEQGVTVLCCVSTQVVMLLEALDGPDADVELPALRVVFTGGEAIPRERTLRFEDRTGATTLQFFGSNETGLLSATRLGDDVDTRLGTCGHVVAEMNVRLFDDGVDVTAGGRGQPGCRGPATSPGYHRDEAANAQLFTADGWMLMGDICTLDDRGRLRLDGRLSDIIIRGGKNISAVQVEEEVLSHPAVALAAAVAVPDPVYGERVCACVELRAGRTLALDDLREHLMARGTSRELHPEHLVVFDEIPRSSGGKVAKGELAAAVAERLKAAGRR